MCSAVKIMRQWVNFCFWKWRLWAHVFNMACAEMVLLEGSGLPNSIVIQTKFQSGQTIWSIWSSHYIDRMINTVTSRSCLLPGYIIWSHKANFPIEKKMWEQLCHQVYRKHVPLLLSIFNGFSHEPLSCCAHTPFCLTPLSTYWFHPPYMALQPCHLTRL